MIQNKERDYIVHKLTAPWVFSLSELSFPFTMLFVGTPIIKASAEAVQHNPKHFMRLFEEVNKGLRNANNKIKVIVPIGATVIVNLPTIIRNRVTISFKPEGSNKYYTEDIYLADLISIMGIH